MTDTVDLDAELAKFDDQGSRLHKPPRAEPDDYATAGDRIESFWRRFKTGRIHTSIETETIDDVVFYTATALVYKNADSSAPEATAHATRSVLDPDPITQEYPQETAETAAVSRALRYLGVLTKPKKTTKETK